MTRSLHRSRVLPDWNLSFFFFCSTQTAECEDVAWRTRRTFPTGWTRLCVSPLSHYLCRSCSFSSSSHSPCWCLHTFSIVSNIKAFLPLEEAICCCLILKSSFRVKYTITVNTQVSVDCFHTSTCIKLLFACCQSPSITRGLFHQEIMFKNIMLSHRLHCCIHAVLER